MSTQSEIHSSGTRRLLYITLAAVCTVALTAHAASPTVLVSDNFNAATGNTTDLNVDITRQTGTLAPVNYTMASGSGHYGHQLQNVNAPDQLLLADFPNSTSSLNFNFNGANSSGGLKISFDLDSIPIVYGGTSDNWGCINLGLSVSDQLANVNQGVTHFGILFRGAGTLQAFDGATVVSPPAEPVYSTRPAGTTNHIDLVITDTDGNPFDGTGKTIIEVFANGGALPVWSYTKAGGYANNYVNLQGSFRAHFDNLVISRLPANQTPTIANPSFEADTFTVFPGYVSGNGPITGWNALGSDGVNPGTFGGPFTDNGQIPDGTKAAFLQEDGPFSQVISGFTIGATYSIRYYENSRNCCSGTAPFCEVQVGGQTIVAAHAVPPVGGSNPYRLVNSDPFVATSTALQLSFVKSNPQGGDTTLLIDNISVVAPNTPPTINVQPQDQVAALGETATFTASASGSQPLAYQWYFGPDAVSGATSPTLELFVDFPDVAGGYYLVVANSAGSATSRVATLTVRAAVPGLFNTGVDDNKAALADGAVDPHYKLIVNADGPSQDALVEDSTAFPIVSGPWVANTASSKWIGPRFDTSGAAGLASGNGVYVYRLSFDLTGIDRGSVIITGNWAVDNGGLSVRVNGQATGLVNNNGFATLTPFTLSSANATFIDGLNTLDFEVQNVDDVAGYTGLRVTDLRGLATLPSTPPVITLQPQSQEAATGETVTFTALATGSSPLSLQWRKNGGIIPGATAFTLTLNNVMHADAGSYALFVENSAGSATSAVAILTVRDSIPTLFNTGVDDAKAALPDNSVDPHYKLIVNPDSTSPDAIVEDSSVFPIVTGPWVANNAGSKWVGPRFETSGAAGGDGAAGDYTYRLLVDLTGFDPASIIITGLWSTDNAGSDILVNGISTGQPNSAQFVAFTPFRLTNGFTHGVNAIDFKLNNSAVGYTGLRVDQIRGLGDALPPNTPPFIITQPQGATVAFGTLVTLNVVANGSAPLSYQWFFGPDPLLGETGPTLSFLFEFSDQVGGYHVEISNAAGSVTSATATITGPNEPPSFTKGPDITLGETDAPAAYSFPHWATGIVSGPPGEPPQALTFILTTDNPDLLISPAIDPASGMLTFVLAPNMTGVANVTVVLMDDGGTASGGVDKSAPQTFQVHVQRVNHCPVGLSQSVTTVENVPVNITLVGTDADNDPLTYLIVSAPSRGTLAGAGASLTYTPAQNTNGTDSFTFAVSDGMCTSAVATVTIRIRPRNEPPTAIAKASTLCDPAPNMTNLTVISANGSNGCVILDGSMSSDPDEDPLTFAWFDDGAALPFAVGAVVTNCFDLGTHVIRLVVDDGHTTSTDTVEVEVITACDGVEQLIATINTADIARKTKRPFIASLKAACASFERGDFAAGVNQLGAFQNKVRAQIGSDNPALAGQWIGEAQRIIDAVLCGQ